MILIQSTQELRDNLQDIANLKRFGFDTETTGLCPHINKLLSIQVGNIEKQYIIDCRKVNPSPLKKIFEDKTIIKYCANGSFDYKFLLKHDIWAKGFYDVLNAERILYAGVERYEIRNRWSLDALSRKYLNKKLDKETRKSFINYKGEFTEEQLDYMVQDVIMPLRIFKEQRDKLRSQGLMKTFHLETEVLQVFAQMEFNGMYLNKNKWLSLYKRNLIDCKKYKGESKELFRDVLSNNLLNEVDLNLNSDPQMAYGFKRLGYDLDSYGEDKISVEIPKSIHKPILKFRQYEKALSTYGLSWVSKINPITNRIHSSIYQVGTSTGRPAGRNPNPLNIPKEDKYRFCFMAQEESSMLLTNDISGQEISIMVELSGEQSWLDAIKKGESIHSLVGSKLFSLITGKEIIVDKSNKTTELFGTKIKNKDLYDITKGINFGLAYGAGPMKIMEQCRSVGINCDMDQAKEIVDAHKKICPNVHRMLEEKRNFVLENEYAISLGGRKRYFSYPKINEMKGNDHKEKFKNFQRTIHAIRREGGNFYVQASAADEIKRAMVFLADEIEKKNKRNELLFLLCQYDELVLESKNNHEENQQIVQDCMIRGQEYYQHTVPAIVDGKISKTWQK